MTVKHVKRELLRIDLIQLTELLKIANSLKNKASTSISQTMFYRALEVIQNDTKIFDSTTSKRSLYKRYHLRVSDGLNGLQLHSDWCLCPSRIFIE